MHVSAFGEGAVPILIPSVAGGAGTDWRGRALGLCSMAGGSPCREHEACYPAGPSGAKGLWPSLLGRPVHKMPS